MTASRRTPMNHYTDRNGYNGIRAVSPWRFRAGRQRMKSKPYGAYFTTLIPTDANFVRRVRLPKAKRQFRFSFKDVGDLVPLPGPGGKWVCYSPTDYLVSESRQLFCGRA